MQSSVAEFRASLARIAAALIVFAIGLAFAPPALAALPSSPPARADYVCTTTEILPANTHISANTTWNTAGKCYTYSGTLTVDSGFTLTIGPDVTVQSSGAELLVLGTLNAVGTAGHPVIFTSTAVTKDRGDWSGIHIQSANGIALNTGSGLNYVTIEYGGSSIANLWVDKATATVSNSTIRESAGHGAYASAGGSFTMTNTALNYNGDPFSGGVSHGYPVYLADPNVDSTLSGLAVSSDSLQNAEVAIAGGTITTAVRWEQPGDGVPYNLRHIITVGNGGTLTIDPGVAIKMWLYSLSVSTGGRLYAIGTQGSPITFARIDPASSWPGIVFNGTSTAPLTGSAIEWTTIDAAQDGISLDYASPLIRHVTITNSGRYGIYSSYESSPTITDTTVTGSGSFAYQFSWLYGNPVLTRLAASGNGLNPGTGDTGNWNYNSVSSWAHEARMDQTLTEPGLPYVARLGISVPAGRTLTIEPGVEIQFDSTRDLQVWGRLMATGTAAEPILFTSAQYPTNTRTRGFWGSVAFTGFESAPSTGSVLDYVTVEYGGYSSSADVETNWGQVSISSSVIRHSGGDGVHVGLGGDAVSIQSSQILIDQAALNATVAYGVHNGYPNTSVVSAPNNWWGHATGPTMALCGANGTGSNASAGVDFIPIWGSTTGAPGTLAPGSALTLSLSPDSWFVPANNTLVSTITATLVDGAGNPVPGRQLLASASRGTVQAGITDATGRAIVLAKSGAAGDADVTVRADPTSSCELIRRVTTTITYTAVPPGWVDYTLVNSSSPYTSADINWGPRPTIVGVPLTVTVKVANPYPHDIIVDGHLYISQSGIGLTPLGQIGLWIGQRIPAGGSITLQAPYTPVAVGHYCYRFDYAWVQAGTAGDQAVRDNASAGANDNAKPASESDQMKELVKKQLEERNKPRAKRPIQNFGNQGSEENKDSTGSALDSAKTGYNDFTTIGGAGRGPGQFALQASGTQGSTGSLSSPSPRQDFTIIAVPVRPYVKVYQAGDDGMTAQEATALNEMLSAWMDTIALTRAVRISGDRYAGAAEAGNLTWMAQQMAAQIHYETQLGTAMLTTATAIENWLAIYPANRETLPTMDYVVQTQARLAATGFTAQEIAAYQRFGMTNEQLEWIRLEYVNSNPADLLVSYRQDLSEAVADLRELGTLLANPPPMFSQQISSTSIAGQAASPDNLAAIGAVEETIEVGNPTAATATIQLQIRRLGMPANWSVTPSPSTLTGVAPGEHRTVRVLISPPAAAPQGSVARFAVEAYIGGVLQGGVQFQVTVPTYARFSAGFTQVFLPFGTRH